MSQVRRPVSILEQQLDKQDKVYFALYQKLKEYAVSILNGSNDIPEQIKHDVSHSEALMAFADVILKRKARKGSLTEKELFLLNSSFYFHDLGMQKWRGFLQIKGSRGNLSREDRLKIRQNHAATTGKFIRSLREHLPYSLEKELNSTEKQILCEDLNEELAFVCESHNKKNIAAYLEKEVKERFSGNNLRIDFITAILQFCDTMHMDKSRLNEKLFLDESAKWEQNQPTEASYEEGDWMRFFQCYYVESSKVTKKHSDTFEIKLHVRFNSVEHPKRQNAFLHIYENRFQRSRDDLRAVLERQDILFIDRSPFVIDKADSAKRRLPERLFVLFDQSSEVEERQSTSPAVSPPIEDGGNMKKVKTPLGDGKVISEGTKSEVPPGMSEASRLLDCMRVVLPSETELRDLCLVSFEDVHRNLREMDRRDHIARQIISHCKSRGITDVLWNLMRQRNPKTTAKYEV